MLIFNKKYEYNIFNNTHIFFIKNDVIKYYNFLIVNPCFVIHDFYQ